MLAARVTRTITSSNVKTPFTYAVYGRVAVDLLRYIRYGRARSSHSPRQFPLQPFYLLLLLLNHLLCCLSVRSSPN